MSGSIESRDRKFSAFDLICGDEQFLAVYFHRVHRQGVEFEEPFPVTGGWGKLIDTTVGGTCD